MELHNAGKAVGEMQNPCPTQAGFVVLLCCMILKLIT